jgi:uncharacterized protein (DUF2147 family)
MSKGRKKDGQEGKTQVQAAMRRMYGRLALLLTTVAFIIIGAVFLFHGRHSGAESPGPSATTEGMAAPAAKADFDRLKGRWQRPDGGYVIEIKDIDASGKMAAGYFNPRPINVSQAEAALDGTTLKVFIELRDVNYPGATYHLTYDPESDQLRGVYFQPKLQQRFDVFFVRMK